MSAAPLTTTELPGIYRSGDLIIANPEESCVIFVTVILVSAMLEFLLQRMSNVGNKYARIVIMVMQQEITIVGVLALFLTFTISLVPKRFITALYVQLFTWAIMSLFFMACLFVFVVVFQFAFAAIDMSRWKNFEEGRMENEELTSLSYRERIYKQFHVQYERELSHRTPFSVQQIPFHEALRTALNKQLVRMSNLQYRTWLSLSFMVLLNLLRTRLSPALSASETDIFTNALMFVFIVGFGGVVLFLGYFFLLQVRVQHQGLTGAAEVAKLKGTPGGNPLTIAPPPLGTSKRAIEFLQVVVLSLNWYVTLFITGNARQMADLPSAWRKGTIFALFAVPVLTVLFLLPWTMMCIALLSCVSNVSAPAATRIFRRIKGDDADDDDDEESDDDDDGDEVLEKEKQSLLVALGRAEDFRDGPPDKVLAPITAADMASQSQVSMSTRSKTRGTMFSGDTGSMGSKGLGGKAGGSDAGTGSLRRPMWLDPDDEWDGTSTIVRASRSADGEVTYADWRRSRRSDMLSSHSDGTADGSGAILASGRQPRAPTGRVRLDGTFFGTLDLERLREHLEKEVDVTSRDGGAGSFTGSAPRSRLLEMREAELQDAAPNRSFAGAGGSSARGGRPVWYEEGDSADLVAQVQAIAREEAAGSSNKGSRK